jgi:hypothetical protein
MRPENYAGVDKCMYSTELEWYESFHIEETASVPEQKAIPVVTQIHWR